MKSVASFLKNSAGVEHECLTLVEKIDAKVSCAINDHRTFDSASGEEMIFTDGVVTKSEDQISVEGGTYAITAYQSVRVGGPPELGISKILYTQEVKEYDLLLRLREEMWIHSWYSPGIVVAGEFPPHTLRKDEYGFYSRIA